MRPATPQPLSLGTVLFPEADLCQLAKDRKFTLRAPRKIDCLSLLAAAVCAHCLQGSPSGNDLAAQPAPLFRHDHRVLVQDRTIRKPPGHLFADFSGVASAHATVCNARIQAVYNLRDHHWVAAAVDPYGKNDLAAAPVAVETANLRRWRAKKETHGHQPSPAVLALMDCTIFITTIPATLAGFKAILALYGLRWRIEIIFKAWKSHLKFPRWHRVSKLQPALLLKARLLLSPPTPIWCWARRSGGCGKIMTGGSAC